MSIHDGCKPASREKFRSWLYDTLDGLPEGERTYPTDVVECVCGRSVTVPCYGSVVCECGAYLAWYWNMLSDGWVVIGLCYAEQHTAFFLPWGVK